MKSFANPFTLLPAAWRKAVYGTFAAVALVSAVIGVAFSSAEVPDPTWLIVLNSVIEYLAVPVGVLAISNMPTSPGEVIEAVQAEAKPDDLL